MLTVTHLIDSFHAHLAVSQKIGQIDLKTVNWYGYQLAKLRAAAGNFPAADLRAHHLVTVDFTHHFVRGLKSLYKWASDPDVQLVPINPFRKLKTPACGERQRVMSREEFFALLGVAPPPFRRFLRLMSYTLARPGELRQLRWSQVHFKESALILDKFKGKKQRTDGKKVRVIPLCHEALRLLAAIYKHQGRPAPDAFVLRTSRQRKPWSANALRSAMRRARDAAGLDIDGTERVVCYTVRHTGATNATRAGVRDRLLADIMGHTTTNTTRRYQHLDTSDLVEGINRIAAANRPPVSGPGAA